MDNDTLVEAFKFLKYMQLSNNSLVSKRFRNLIRTHRHSLALLYVDWITMTFVKTSDRYQIHRPTVQIFDKVIIPEAYNEWVFRNNYWKQIPYEGQVARKQNTQFSHDVFELSAVAVSKEVERGRTSAFFAVTKVNHENWPLFQHFVRLITDPFINIGTLELTAQNDVLKLLARSITCDRSRLRCEKLKVDYNRVSEKFVRQLKNHVRCDEFQIYDRCLNCHIVSHCHSCDEKFLDEVFLDLFLTGARCTSKIDMKYYEPSKVIVGFVQKFMGLKKCDEYQIVESIECFVAKRPDQELMRKCADFIVKKENNRDITEHVFEFVNDDIGKKLKLTVKIYHYTFLVFASPYRSYFVLKIENL
ncbi:hypothetical protein Ddc_16540 [Ditylenchus destructor]|nr:hypothetical protein Ddc_16540 [Ditylenchus destructor]